MWSLPRYLYFKHQIKTPDLERLCQLAQEITPDRYKEDKETLIIVHAERLHLNPEEVIRLAKSALHTAIPAYIMEHCAQNWVFSSLAEAGKFAEALLEMGSEKSFQILEKLTPRVRPFMVIEEESTPEEVAFVLCLSLGLLEEQKEDRVRFQRQALAYSQNRDLTAHQVAKIARGIGSFIIVNDYLWDFIQQKGETLTPEECSILHSAASWIVIKTYVPIAEALWAQASKDLESQLADPGLTIEHLAHLAGASYFHGTYPNPNDKAWKDQSEVIFKAVEMVPTVDEAINFSRNFNSGLDGSSFLVEWVETHGISTEAEFMSLAYQVDYQPSEEGRTRVIRQVLMTAAEQAELEVSENIFYEMHRAREFEQLKQHMGLPAEMTLEQLQGRFQNHPYIQAIKKVMSE